MGNAKSRGTVLLIGKGAKKASTEQYLRAEFRAMDVNNDHKLGVSDFYKLMTNLGYSEGSGGPKVLLKRTDKDMDKVVTEDEFVAAIKDPAVLQQTSSLRDLFSNCDKDGDLTATKDEVIAGFKKTGIKPITQEMQKKIESMDENKDKKITYVEFLRVQFGLR
ncbi:hypothetical protein ScPMuIL_009346 [Solemya velum]